MSGADEDPRCPECGEPIGMTATYCMHCSADLTDELEAADADQDGAWDEPTSATGGATGTSEPAPESSTGDEELLDPDGIVDNTLTVVVGILAGIFVGFLGTFVLTVVTGSGLGLLFGFVTWLGATAYLVRRRTVQGALAHGAYAVAIVLLLVPFIAVSPVVSVSGGLVGRLQAFVVLLVIMGIPAAIAAVVGFAASRFVPEDAAGSVE